MQVSFIIPHKGRFEMLIQTLESISLQTCNQNDIEVIVVSQTPEIQQQVLSTNNALSLSVHIRPTSETISGLRNYGVTKANGEYLAFLDADVYLSHNWVEQMLTALDHDSNRIICSSMQICEESAPPLEQIRTALSNAELDTDVAFLPGRNLCLKKTSFENIGGFPEHLITCEDYYFTDQAAKLGTLFYTSSANYIHLGEDKKYKAMFYKEIWRGQSNLQSISGRNIPIREWPSFAVPPAIMLMLISSIFLFIINLNLLAMTSLIFAVIPIFIYSIRLYLLANKKIHLWYIVVFYIFYFPARAIGTFAGLFKSIGVKTL
ncbi:glycosyltransferase family A protein [uncultured Paraglaciecola sp.]|uniref:glycosyltransferase n=1 Tax=uncultured Paraglaciecola sp. TaxID=1765024 RepID=UPI002593302D|nr:glycosyltransferase family A protein [uncultured Paraglaciecola sp.]